jgi:hypothetical protein
VEGTRVYWYNSLRHTGRAGGGGAGNMVSGPVQAARTVRERVGP